MSNQQRLSAFEAHAHALRQAAMSGRPLEVNENLVTEMLWVAGELRDSVALCKSLAEVVPEEAEMRAFLDLCDAPSGLLRAHGWAYQHAPLTIACANKLRRLGGLPMDNDLPPEMHP